MAITACQVTTIIHQRGSCDAAIKYILGDPACWLQEGLVVEVVYSKSADILDNVRVLNFKILLSMAYSTWIEACDVLTIIQNLEPSEPHQTQNSKFKYTRDNEASKNPKMNK